MALTLKPLYRDCNLNILYINKGRWFELSKIYVKVNFYSSKPTAKRLFLRLKVWAPFVKENINLLIYALFLVVFSFNIFCNYEIKKNTRSVFRIARH